MIMAHHRETLQKLDSLNSFHMKLNQSAEIFCADLTSHYPTGPTPKFLSAKSKNRKLKFDWDWATKKEGRMSEAGQDLLGKRYVDHYQLLQSLLRADLSCYPTIHFADALCVKKYVPTFRTAAIV